MSYRILCLLFFLCLSVSAADTNIPESFILNTSAPENRNLEFAYRKPNVTSACKYKPAILVLFGGRNWQAERSLRIYKFNKLANKYNLYLLSSSFKNDQYWHPQKWSGKALLEALEKLKEKFNLNQPKIYYYGYSAGGQCANLFYFWKPEIVSAVALHACGVYPAGSLRQNIKTPFLITCGEGDNLRFQISYTFAQRLREVGTPVIFKNYSGGHELNREALNLARSFFADVIEGKSEALYAAEDFINNIYPITSQRALRIDPEFVNKFYSKATAQAWLIPQASKD